MGFFSDLKEDLSQAVNELMPEEASEALNAVDAAMASDTEAKDTSSGEQLTNAALMKEETVDTVDSVDLISMLDKLEDLDTAEEPLEEVIVSPDTMPEDMAWMTEAESDTAEIVPEETGMPETSAQEQQAETVQESDVIAEPAAEAETAAEAVQEPEMIGEPETEKEINSDDTIVGLSGEEEENMDAQTQEQTQVQTQAQEQIERVAVDETAVVTEGMTITGDIVSAGSMELIGTVNGNLDIYGKLNITGTIQGDSKAAEIYAESAKITGEVHSQGSVKIGQSSVVIGNIVAASAVIAGAVKGDIDVQGPVILDTTAIVMGNIKSKSVQINNGAVIEGLCSQCYADVNPTSFFEEFKKKK